MALRAGVPLLHILHVLRRVERCHRYLRCYDIGDLVEGPLGRMRPRWRCPKPLAVESPPSTQQVGFALRIGGWITSRARLSPWVRRHLIPRPSAAVELLFPVASDLNGWCQAPTASVVRAVFSAVHSDAPASARLPARHHPPAQRARLAENRKHGSAGHVNIEHDARRKRAVLVAAGRSSARSQVLHARLIAGRLEPAVEATRSLCAPSSALTLPQRQGALPADVRPRAK